MVITDSLSECNAGAAELLSAPLVASRAAPGLQQEPLSLQEAVMKAAYACVAVQSCCVRHYRTWRPAQTAGVHQVRLQRQQIHHSIEHELAAAVPCLDNMRLYLAEAGQQGRRRHGRPCPAAQQHDHSPHHRTWHRPETAGPPMVRLQRQTWA